VKSCLLFRFDWGERRERDRETETETECVCKCERDKIGDKHTP
jgi:hypothetical protein